MTSETKAKVALAVGTLLSIPVLRGAVNGQIGTTTAAMRVVVAMAVAYLGVALITAIVGGYMPKPAPEEEPPLADGVDEAVLVEPDGPVPETDG